MTRDLWEYLANTDKPIVMYGMGNGADKILNVCNSKKIDIKDFFASDGFVRGHSFHGKRVLSYSETKEKYGTGNFIVLLSFASSLPDVIQTIKNIAQETELYAPDVPVHGQTLFDHKFYSDHKSDFETARELFSDDQSKLVYDNVIKYKLSGKIDYLTQIDTECIEAYNDLLHAKDFEVSADLGAYNGDTIRELAQFSPNLKKIFAFEPDKRNYRKLNDYASSQSSFDILSYNLAAWSGEETLFFGSEGNRNSGVGNVPVNAKTAKITEIQANSLDNILLQSNTERLDYVKYDVEGAEYQALLGSLKSIKKYNPALLVSLYHQSEDLYSLPLMLAKELYGYKFYLRKFRYIPAWDLNLYAVPPTKK